MSDSVYGLLRLGLSLFGAFTAMLWIALVLWVYRDSQARSDNFLLTLLSTALVASTFVVGWVVYMLLRPQYTLAELYQRQLHDRQALLEATTGELCPRCDTRIQLDYRLCPCCGLEVKQPCDMCKRPIRPTWNLCPYCGFEVHRALPSLHAPRPPES